MHRFEMRVRYADVDAMGWTYYGHYLKWFEIGRAEMLRSLGRSYADVEREEGILLPVLDARCRYSRGARYDERVVVDTGVLSLGRASVHFGYRIAVLVDGDEVECAVGYTEHCMTDRDARVVRPPASLTALLDAAPRVAEAIAQRVLAAANPRGR